MTPTQFQGSTLTTAGYWGSWENDRFGLEDWLKAGSDHTLTITASEVITKERTADYVADFSSRGTKLRGT